MKLALITDSHWGTRNDSEPFINANKKFLDKVFFPTIKEHDISTVIHLGDMVERRKFVNFLTAKRLREDFIDPLSTYLRSTSSGQFIWILGNHDLFYKHSLEVSVAYELARDFPIAIVDHPCEFGFSDTKVLMVPWMTDDNKAQCHYAINNTESTILMGHLELQGFEMYRGVPSHVGDDSRLLRKFDRVFSGHFHHKHNRDNIYYLGAMGDYSWADYDDDRGFHLFDTCTQELTFIKNPYTMFAKVYYDDGGEYSVIPKDGFEYLAGKLVKVIIRRQINSDQFDWFYTQLESAKPLNIQTIREEETSNFTVNAASIADKDTLTVIRDCIKVSNTSVSSVKLERLFEELYRESQDVE